MSLTPICALCQGCVQTVMEVLAALNNHKPATLYTEPAWPDIGPELQVLCLSMWVHLNSWALTARAITILGLFSECVPYNYSAKKDVDSIAFSRLTR